MNTIPEKDADRPELYRVACELASYENPHKALNALTAVLNADTKGGPGSMNEKPECAAESDSSTWHSSGRQSPDS